jgi:hypothetical protein
MKKKTLMAAFVAALVIIGTVSLQAQERRAGIKGGLNMSNLYVDNQDLNDENARLGFHVGVFGELISTPLVALQLELNYSTRGTRTVYDGIFAGEYNFNLNYIDLPVLAVVKLGTIELHAGPYFGYLIGANVKTEGALGSGYRELNRDNFNTLDYGLAGGVGFNFGEIQIGARYNYGLKEVAKNEASRDYLGDSKNQLAQLYIAFPIQ